MSSPRFSVVTPFHNTAPYLAQCIDSVLGQSLGDFEYILVDNCSSDGSEKIAADYAHRDARIRLVRRPTLLPQVENYNAALAEIGDGSAYCKMVQADDFIFPRCLESMAEAFEQSDRIGLVSSYYLKGRVVRGSGFPPELTHATGQQVARMYLLDGIYAFGSPTTVAYRSSIVRETRPFFEPDRLHEDTERCFEILKSHDVGFVPQVLSFLRTDNESISSSVREYSPDALDAHILAQRFAGAFLTHEEASAARERMARNYYAALARGLLSSKRSRFWDYHRDGLRRSGVPLERRRLLSALCRVLAWRLVNPGQTMMHLSQRLRRHRTPGDPANRTNCP